jgi:CheY-like chemotaxis protein
MQKRRFAMPAPKKTLLLVEDDSQLRLLLFTIFTQSGYRVRAAEDGLSALAQIRAAMPDIVLSDLYMPGMSGFELLSIIRRRFPAISVIAMSSAFSAGEVPEGVAADAFYQKATSVLSLLRLVEDAGNPERPASVRRQSQSAPIWVPSVQAQSGFHGHVVIACPECLRTFAYASGLGDATVRTVHCASCQVPIHYAMVQTLDPGPAKATRLPPGIPAASLLLSAAAAD